MASIRNNGVWPLAIPNGAPLQRGEARTVTNADLDTIDMARALPALVASGDVTVTRDAPVIIPQGEPEIMPARYGDQPQEEPEGIPEVSPVRTVEPEPQEIVADPIPEAAPEIIPETPAIEAVPSKKGA